MHSAEYSIWFSSGMFDSPAAMEAVTRSSASSSGDFLDLLRRCRVSPENVFLTLEEVVDQSRGPWACFGALGYIFCWEKRGARVGRVRVRAIDGNVAE